MRIGFVGAGLMGAPMVGNLVAAGHDVVVSSRTPERLADTGWTVVGSPAEAARDADIVCSIVPLPSGFTVMSEVLRTHPVETMAASTNARAREDAGMWTSVMRLRSYLY